jgi:hypothetical protein
MFRVRPAFGRRAGQRWGNRGDREHASTRRNDVVGRCRRSGVEDIDIIVWCREGAIASPVRTFSGYPAAATTVVTAAARFHTNGATPANDSPRPTAANTARSELSSSGSNACVSGSPNLQLNSTTFGPVSVNISPAYSNPVNGVPFSRSAVSVGRVSVGRIISRSARSRNSGVSIDTGAYAPIPPVFGPASPSSSRL